MMPFATLEQDKPASDRPLNASQLEHWILDNYPGVIVTNAYRERSFFYNPDRSLPKGIYFATIKESDGPNDKASHLDREGVWRWSAGVGKEAYRTMFGDLPKRPAKGGTVDVDHDFTALGVVMPHPVYAWMGWVCINNPDIHHVMAWKHLLDNAYRNASLQFAGKR